MSKKSEMDTICARFIEQYSRNENLEAYKSAAHLTCSQQRVYSIGGIRYEDWAVHNGVVVSIAATYYKIYNSSLQDGFGPSPYTKDVMLQALRLIVIHHIGLGTTDMETNFVRMHKACMQFVRDNYSRE